MKMGKFAGDMAVKALVKTDPLAAKTMLDAINTSSSFEEFIATPGMNEAFGIVSKRAPGAKAAFRQMYSACKKDPAKMRNFMAEVNKACGVSEEAEKI